MIPAQCRAGPQALVDQIRRLVPKAPERLRIVTSCRGTRGWPRLWWPAALPSEVSGSRPSLTMLNRENAILAWLTTITRAEARNHREKHMSKIIDAQDILNRAASSAFSWRRKV
jgi:hypothetical protein